MFPVVCYIQGPPRAVTCTLRPFPIWPHRGLELAIYMWDLSWGIVARLEFALKDCEARAGGISLRFGMAQSLEMAQRFITLDTAL